ncbi:MAG: hypothetical protein Q8784_01245 [Vigna little leaf phytoplasma]|nr:hypothetical protein [Vigna little leaf phytoplasma]
MQQNDTLMNTTKGKVIVGVIAAVGVIALYLIIAFMFSWIPFRVTADKVRSECKFEPTQIKQDSDIDTADKAKNLVISLKEAATKIENKSKSLKVDTNDKVVAAKKDLDDLITSADNASKAAPYDSNAFKTAYNAVTADKYTNYVNAVIEAANLK